MSKEDLEKEFQHMKLHGMPQYPTPQKSGCLKKIITLLIIAIIIIAIIAFAKSGLQF